MGLVLQLTRSYCKSMEEHTDPSQLPRDVARKVLAAHEALIRDDLDEAYHQLYLIADPTCTSFTPFAKLEAVAGLAEATT